MSEPNTDWIDFLSDGTWLNSLNVYSEKRLCNNTAWSYALMTSIAWFVTYLILQRSRYEYANANIVRPSWEVSEYTFALFWIINHLIIGYVVYVVHVKYNDIVSDVLFVLNLALVIIMFTEEFIGKKPKVTLVFQIINLIATIGWMIYIVRLGTKVGYILLFYIAWLIYWIAVNVEIMRLNPSL